MPDGSALAPELKRAPKTTGAKSSEANGAFVGIAGCLVIVAIALGALWLLIAIIKWMWTNS
jgi:hypothetical protein